LSEVKNKSVKFKKSVIILSSVHEIEVLSSTCRGHETTFPEDGRPLWPVS
jgi:hypothetical protein